MEAQLAFKDGVAEHFAEQVKGAKAGDSRIVEIVLSDSVAEPSLRAKTVQAVFEIKDIKVLRLPELTHELLHHFGVHSPEQLRELIRVHLERQLSYEQRRMAREQVLAQIAAAAQWELPQDLLIRQARKALARKVMEMRADNMPEEQIQQQQRMLQQNILQSTELALKELPPATGDPSPRLVSLPLTRHSSLTKKFISLVRSVAVPGRNTSRRRAIG